MTPTEHKDLTRRHRSQNKMGTSNTNLLGKHTRTVRRAGHGEVQKKIWNRQKMRSTPAEHIKLDHMEHIHACMLSKLFYSFTWYFVSPVTYREASSGTKGEVSTEEYLAKKNQT